jgi:hypothetical protein
MSFLNMVCLTVALAFSDGRGCPDFAAGGGRQDVAGGLMESVCGVVAAG